MIRASHSRLAPLGGSVAASRRSLPALSKVDHHLLVSSESLAQRRWMGSFQDFSQNDSWYKESLRGAVADLRRDLELDDPVPYQSQQQEPFTAPHTTSSDENNNIIQELQRMVSGNDDDILQSDDVVRELQQLALDGNESTSATDLNRAFFLMDQLIQENLDENNSLDDFSSLDTEFLNQLVAKWRDCWIVTTTSLPTDQNLLAPWDLLTKLDQYPLAFPQFVPDTTTYNLILSVACQWELEEDDKGDGVLQIALFVQSVVDQMKLEEHIHPNATTYNLLLQAWARAGNLPQVLEILQSYERNKKQESLEVHPNTLQAITETCQAHMGTMAEIQKFIQLPSLPSNLRENKPRSRSRKTTTHGVHMTDAEIAETISRWKGTPNGVDKSFRLLDRIVLSSDNDSKLKNSIPTHLICDLLWNWRKAWMKKSTIFSPRSIVDKILLYHDCPTIGFEADTRTFNILIAALALDGHDRKRALQWGEHLFERMTTTRKDDGEAVPEPDSKTYKAMIQLYTKAGNVQGALDLLISLRDSSAEATITIGPENVDAILDACINMDGDHRNLGTLAEGIIDLMKQLEDVGRLTSEAKELSTKKRIYAKVVQCWEKSGHPNAVERIQTILNDLDEPNDSTESAMADTTTKKPDTLMSNSLIRALAKQGKAREAQEQLERMCRAVDEGQLDLEPTTGSFNAVLNAWAQKGSVRETEALLEKMIQYTRSVAPGKVKVQPNTFSYNCVLMAYHRSGEPEAGPKADALLEQMEELPHAKPDRFSVQTSMLCWQDCSAERPDAKKRIAILKKKRSSF